MKKAAGESKITKMPLSNLLLVLGMAFLGKDLRSVMAFTHLLQLVVIASSKKSSSPWSHSSTLR